MLLVATRLDYAPSPSRFITLSRCLARCHHSVSAEGLNAKEWHNTWAAIFFLLVLLISLVLVLLLVGVVFSMYTFINLTKRSGQRLSSLKQVEAVFEVPDAESAPPQARELKRHKNGS